VHENFGGCSRDGANPLAFQVGKGCDTRRPVGYKAVGDFNDDANEAAILVSGIVLEPLSLCVTC